MCVRSWFFGLSVAVLVGDFAAGCGDRTVKPAPKTAPRSAKPASPAADKPQEVKLSADGKTLLKYRGAAEEFAVPAGVTAIADGAFAECGELTAVTLPEGVATIGERAFANCQNLRSVKLPSTLTTIGKEAFWWCSNLTSVAIPPAVRTIGDGAFNECPCEAWVKERFAPYKR